MSTSLRRPGLAVLLEERLDPALLPHVGVLLPNGPAFALHLAAAGFGGHVPDLGTT